MNHAEHVARTIFAKALLDPLAEPIPGAAFELTRRLFGAGTIKKAVLVEEDARVGELAGRTVIAHRATMSRARANFAVAQMLARVFLEDDGVQDRDLEEQCAAWIVAPTPTVQAVISLEGLNVKKIGAHFEIPQTSAAIRALDAIKIDGAVTTPRRVHKRGALGGFGDDVIRELAGRPNPQTLRRVTCSDERGTRVALFPKQVERPLRPTIAKVIELFPSKPRRTG